MATTGKPRAASPKRGQKQGGKPGKDDAKQRELLLLLDGHSLAYRAFFALPAENFSTTTGQPTKSV